MAYQQLQIKDIYIGNVDAKDEFTHNSKEFIENFILPRELDINEFFNGSKMFIEGLKGTGKTALLYYLKNIKDVEKTPTDLILFKTHYDEIKRNKLEKQNDKIIQVNTKDDINEKNFTYIWRLTLLSKILAFNIENNYAFYQKSKDLDILTKLIQTIVKKQKKNIFSSYLKSIRTAKISTKNADFETALEFDFESIEINDEDDLHEKIDLCMTVFRTINQTKSDKTGYIFIDELEAYYDRDDIYKRDL